MNGISFSGGGIRGAASLGIYHALEEKGFEADIFVGTSAGAIVASLLASGHSAEEALHKFEKASSNMIDIAYWHIFKGLVTRKHIEGFVKGDRLESLLEENLGGKYLSEIDKKLGIVTTNISSGCQEVFTNGKLDHNKVMDDHVIITSDAHVPLSKIVRMSTSIPGVFIPKTLYGDRFVDGGLTNNLPSDIAYALGAEKVVSIDLGYDGKEVEIDSVVKLLTQSLDVLMEQANDSSKKLGVDIYLNPEIYDVHVLEFDRLRECFARGYEYGKKMRDEVIKQLGGV